MKIIDKVRQMHPEWTDEHIADVIRDTCPTIYAIGAHAPDWCYRNVSDEDCRRCWNRDIPEITDEVMTAVVKDLATPIDTPVSDKEPTILDSGDRTQFESGAVRDMRAGKGRFDVMPLEVIRDYLEDAVIGYIANFMQNGDTSELYMALDEFSTEFGGGTTMLLETAIHFEQGAVKYGPDNWRKSIPVWCYIDSAVRHYIKWLRGDKEERHDRAFCWNLMCCIWEVDHGDAWRAEHKTKEG